MGHIFKRGKTWWIAYGSRASGIRRESAETASEEQARTLLRLREGDSARGVSIPDNRLRLLTVRDILVEFIDHQRIMGAKSVEHVRRYYVENTLIPAFGNVEVRALTTSMVQQWILSRQASGYTNSSINKCLACLNRALVLAHRSRRIVERPFIPLLKPNPPREGFYTDDEWRTLKAHFTGNREHAWPVMETLRLTGARVSEVLRLEWRNVDLKEGWIRLEGGTTKNGEGRTLPILAALHPVLASLWEQRLQQQSILPWVFTHNGRPIKSIRTAFESARAEAGLPEKKLHDCRRTFRRVLALASIPDKVGQKLMGHKDQKTYQAYFPVIDSDKAKAAAALDKVVSQ